MLHYFVSSTIQNENIRSGGFIKTFLLMSFVSG